MSLNNQPINNSSGVHYSWTYTHTHTHTPTHTNTHTHTEHRATQSRPERCISLRLPNGSDITPPKSNTRIITRMMGRFSNVPQQTAVYFEMPKSKILHISSYHFLPTQHSLHWTMTHSY